MPPPAPLANDLWMAAHDTPRGDPQLPPRPLGIGLTAALLAELVLDNWIWLDNGLIYLNPDGYHYALDDEALAPVLEELRGEVRNIQSRGRAPDPIGVDVETLVPQLHAGGAEQLVQARLQQAGLIQQEVRGMVRKRSVWVPSSGNVAGWPMSRVKGALRDGSILSEQDLALAGLIMAIGLSRSVLADLGARRREYLAQQTHARLRPVLRELVVGAETAVGRLVMIR